MKFTTIDKKFLDAGFCKVEENEHIVHYRKAESWGIHAIELMYKVSGYHLIHSYQIGSNADGLSNSVGLTMYEAKLCRKKMKQKGWKEKK